MTVSVTEDASRISAPYDRQAAGKPAVAGPGMESSNVQEQG